MTNMNLLRKIQNRILKLLQDLQIKREIRNKGGFVGKQVDLTILGKFSFGKSLVLNDTGIDLPNRTQIVVQEKGELSFGNFSGISSTSIYCKEKITIGNHVNIGAGCLIMDSNFHSLDWELRSNRETDCINAQNAPVHIEDYAFIGARSIICKGVTIGQRSIVAAGSVVVTDIPSDQIWGGNPATFIKMIP